MQVILFQRPPVLLSPQPIQADYTAWQLRWLCVEALNSDLRDEYKLTETVMLVRI